MWLRTFPDGLRIPITDDGIKACLGAVNRNGELGVTWVHSYVSDSTRKTFCIYDATDEEAIRRAATRHTLPIDRISSVMSFNSVPFGAGRAQVNVTAGATDPAFGNFVTQQQQAVIVLTGKK